VAAKTTGKKTTRKTSARAARTLRKTPAPPKRVRAQGSTPADLPWSALEIKARAVAKRGKTEEMLYRRIWTVGGTAEYGIVVDVQSGCNQKCCAGPKLGVRWRDGDVTWPCLTKIITRPDGDLQIRLISQIALPDQDDELVEKILEQADLSSADVGDDDLEPEETTLSELTERLQ
jgi:hypothetical protein